MRTTRLCELLAALVLASSVAQAQEQNLRRNVDGDRFEVNARAETYTALFRRALLPGPEGSLVSTETVVPIHQYVSMRARDLDAPWRPDSIDLEVSAWGRIWPTETVLERPLDADVQTAFVSYRHEPVLLRLGRQQVVGGAARFSRFDGMLSSVDLGAGFSALGYAGFRVLPRWDARPGYHHLGSSSDSLLRDESALGDVNRSGYWLVGGRLGYQSRRFGINTSIHEEREQGDISRRNLGLDARAPLFDEARFGGSLLMDLDSARLADTRLWADFQAAKSLEFSIEYLHTEPALWLSRQSVLSVFSTDRFDEAGALAEWSITEAIALEGAAFLSLYDEHRPGARGDGTLRLRPDQRTSVRLSYARVLAPSNGYHSVRSSISRRILTRTSATFEAYAYMYDEAIRQRHTSTVYAGTISYEPLAALSLLLGASLASTPYASLDAQTLLRLAYDFDGRGGTQ
jgi:hypothetical protein